MSMDNLQSRRDRIQRRIDEVKCELRELQHSYNDTAPPNILPAKLLCRIFLELAAESCAGYYYRQTTTVRTTVHADPAKRVKVRKPVPWVLVTHVCHRWRTIAIDCPELWTHLLFLKSPKLTSTMFRRSKESPLALKAVLNPTNKFNGLFTEILSQTHRLTSINLKGSLSYGMLSQTSGSAPLLKEIVMKSTDIASGRLPSSFLPKGAPVLQYMELDSMCIERWESLPVGPHLTHLKIIFSRKYYGNRPTAETFYESLRRMSRLETLWLEDHLPERVKDSTPQTITHTAIVSLPTIRRLHLKDSAGAIGQFFAAVRIEDTAVLRVNIKFPAVARCLNELLEYLTQAWHGLQHGVKDLVVLGESKPIHSSFTFKLHHDVQLTREFGVSENDDGETALVLRLCDENLLPFDDVISALDRAFDMGAIKALWLNGLTGKGHDWNTSFAYRQNLETIVIGHMSLHPFITALRQPCTEVESMARREAGHFPTLKNLAFEYVDLTERGRGIIYMLAEALTYRQNNYPAVKLDITWCRGFDIDSLEILTRALPDLDVTAQGQDWEENSGEEEEPEDDENDMRCLQLIRRRENFRSICCSSRMLIFVPSTFLQPTPILESNSAQSAFEELQYIVSSIFPPLRVMRDDLQTRREDIQRRIKEVKRELQELHVSFNDTALPNLLPPEILCQIFLELAIQSSDEYYFRQLYPDDTREVYILRGRMMRKEPPKLIPWILVTHVCHRWRTVAIDCAQLWTHLLFSQPNLTSLMFNRSKTLPLALRAVVTPRNFDSVLSKILSQTHRLTSVDLRGHLHWQLFSSASRCAPLLEEVILESTESTQGYLPANFLLNGAPRLKHLELEHMRIMSWDALPLGPSLTNLKITSRDPHAHRNRPGLKAFFDYLDRMPHLETLWLDKYLPDGVSTGLNAPHPALQSPASTIHLPALRRINLKDSASAMTQFFAAVKIHDAATLRLELDFPVLPQCLRDLFVCLTSAWRSPQRRSIQELYVAGRPSDTPTGLEFRLQDNNVRPKLPDVFEDDSYVDIALVLLVDNSHRLRLNDMMSAFKENFDLNAVKILRLYYLTEAMGLWDNPFNFLQDLESITICGMTATPFVVGFLEPYQEAEYISRRELGLAPEHRQFPCLKRLAFEHVNLTRHCEDDGGGSIIPMLLETLTSRQGIYRPIELKFSYCNGLTQEHLDIIKESLPKLEIIVVGPMPEEQYTDEE